MTYYIDPKIQEMIRQIGETLKPMKGLIDQISAATPKIPTLNLNMPKGITLQKINFDYDSLRRNDPNYTLVVRNISKDDLMDFINEYDEVVITHGSSSGLYNVTIHLVAPYN